MGLNWTIGKKVCGFWELLKHVKMPVIGFYDEDVYVPVARLVDDTPEVRHYANQLVAMMQKLDGIDATSPNNIMHVVTPAEHATILAALRFYQQNGQGDPDNRSSEIHEIATNGGEEISLDGAGIDDLCKLLNWGAR